MNSNELYNMKVEEIYDVIVQNARENVKDLDVLNEKREKLLMCIGFMNSFFMVPNIKEYCDALDSVPRR